MRPFFLPHIPFTRFRVLVQPQPTSQHCFHLLSMCLVQPHPTIFFHCFMFVTLFSLFSAHVPSLPYITPSVSISCFTSLSPLSHFKQSLKSPLQDTTTKQPKRRRTHLRDMGKEARSAVQQPWIEVAPALFISPKKSSNIPRLETIAEEDRDDCKDHSQLLQSPK